MMKSEPKKKKEEDEDDTIVDVCSWGEGGNRPLAGAPGAFFETRGKGGALETTLGGGGARTRGGGGGGGGGGRRGGGGGGGGIGRQGTLIYGKSHGKNPDFGALFASRVSPLDTDKKREVGYRANLPPSRTFPEVGPRSADKKVLF